MPEYVKYKKEQRKDIIDMIYNYEIIRANIDYEINVPRSP